MTKLSGKVNKILGTVIGGFCLLYLSGCSLQNLPEGTYDPNAKALFSEKYEVITEEESYELELPTEGMKGLNVELGGCKVSINTTEGSQVEIKAKNIYSSSLQAYSENDTIYIKGMKEGVWKGWDKEKIMEVQVGIPKDCSFDKAKLSFGAGDFQISKLMAEELKLEVGAGRLVLDQLNAQNLECQLGAGSFKLLNCEVLEKAKFTAGAGEIQAKGKFPKDLSVECGAGKTEIVVTDSQEEDHNFKLECAAGSIQAGSIQIKGMAENKEVHNGKDSDYHLSCALGSIELSFED